jgi:hypothetical protein
MAARWGSFATGLGLLLAPLALGYASAGAILRDVSTGTLVCVAALAALQWPGARILLGLTALWLLHSGRRSGEPRAAAVELVAGALVLALALLPRRRRVPPLARPASVGEARSA